MFPFQVFLGIWTLDVILIYRPTSCGFCKVSITIMSASSLCSTLFILSMTFERFFSIIRPHKAASFNTVRRATVTIVCIVITSVIYRIPHLFMTSYSGRTCLSHTEGRNHIYVQLYYWTDNIAIFVIPFTLLLIMNSVIVHTLCKRSRAFLGESQGQIGGDGQTPKMKNTEKQIIAMLLLVTFGYLILVTPGYLLLFYTMFVDFTNSPKTYAEFTLVSSIGQKMFYTNFGINFYSYVISGQKFQERFIVLVQKFILPKQRRKPIVWDEFILPAHGNLYRVTKCINSSKFVCCSHKLTVLISTNWYYNNE